MPDQEPLELDGDDGPEEGSGEAENGGHRGVEELIDLLENRLEVGRTEGIEQVATALAAETRRGIALTGGESKRLEAMLATPGANSIPTNLWLDLDSARRTR